MLTLPACPRVLKRRKSYSLRRNVSLAHVREGRYVHARSVAGSEVQLIAAAGPWCYPRERLAYPRYLSPGQTFDGRVPGSVGGFDRYRPVAFHETCQAVFDTFMRRVWGGVPEKPLGTSVLLAVKVTVTDIGG